MKRKFRFTLALLIATAFCSSFSQAQGKCSPPVGLPSIPGANIFSPEQEGFLGDALAERIQREFKLIEDPRLVEYLTRIGERLATELPLQAKLRFHLVDSPEANAWAIAGGRIYVTRKLIAVSENEDELAAVIGHELGHLVTHESAEDYSAWFREVLNVTQVTDRKDVFDKYNQLLEK